MAEGVVLSSMREASEMVDDVKIADVKSLFENPINEGKIILIVEGKDDADVYSNVMNESAVRFYVDGNCEKHVVILCALNGKYGKRLLAIRDADFCRLEDSLPPYNNLLLTDTHDMEGMIITECLPNLQGEDALRCQNINLNDVYDELEDISYLKWFNHASHSGINFRNVSLNLNLSAYFRAAIDNTNNVITVSLKDVVTFKEQHADVNLKELCNGHDLFERIYLRAKEENVSNFAKKPFFRRLRAAYPKEKFISTSLCYDIKSWEKSTGQTILFIS